MTSHSLIICGADDVPDVLAAVPGAALISIRRYGAEELARRCTRRLAAEWRNRILELTKRVG
jgi:hypothetical protein